jgi:hypothetical protein
MATRMQQRRGTAAQWTDADPILAAGEIGFETDTGKFKIGNGTSEWSALSYFADSQDFDTTNFVLNNALGVANGVATLNGDGNIPISQLGALIANAPETLDTLEELATYVTNLDGLIDAHTAVTTNVHGIVDTAALETQTGAQDKADAAQSAAQAAAEATASAALDVHNLDTTGVHGIADTAALETQTGAQDKADSAQAAAEATASAALDAHNAITANVHGILDTAALETQTGAQDKADSAQAAAEATASADASTKADAAQAAAEATASAALNAHNSDSTNVHGIADTADLVLTNDARLSDERTPLDGSVTDAKIDANGLSQSSISGLGTDLAAKAPLESPALTGTPTAPTATAGDNSTKIATTAYVDSAVTALVDSAPGALDTLNELAAALGDDANFSTTVTNSLALKLEQSDLDDALYYEFNSQASSYTLALSDSTNMVEVNSASGVTITVPPNASVAFPVGSYIDIFQKGAGQVTIAEGSGVTIYATPGKKLRTQYSNATLIKRDTNTWILAGDIVA